MNNKNIVIARKYLAIFGLLILLLACFVTCRNSIMEKWWLEDDNTSEPVYQDPVNPGGSGDNFGVVIFDTDGGIPQPKAIKIAWGSVVGRLRPISRGIDGYIGWFDEKGNPWDVETRKINETDDVDGDGFVTLKLKWEAGAYTVKFEPYPSSSVPVTPGNAVTIPAQYIAVGGKVVPPVEPPGLPAPDGRGFAGWYTEDTYIHKWNFSIPPSQDEILYAKWEVDTRIVRFEANGGTRPNGLTDLTHEFTVALSYGLVQDPGPLVKTGFSFGGWYYENQFITPQWDFATKKVTDSEVENMIPLILYAKWIPNKYFVSFVITPSTAAPPPQQTVLHGNTVTKPVNPAQLGDGRGFAGWYTEDTFIYQWDFANNIVTNTMTLYAKFLPQTRTIHFQVNGGTTPCGMDFLPNRTVMVGGKIIDPGTLNRAYYTFGGWYTDPECTVSWNFATNTVTQPDEIIGMDPMYLYAKWTPTKYNVTFNANGGTPTPAMQSVAYGERADRPVTPTYSGNAFVGWYSDSALTNIWDFDNDKVTSVMTLYAKWEVISYTVTFDLREYDSNLLGKIPSNNTTPPAQLIPPGGKAIEPFMPTSIEANKYSFYCWSTSTSGNSPGTVQGFNFDTVISGNITLYARWVEPAPDMIWVPKGSFTMGDSSISGCPAAYHSYPTRRVKVDGFYIGRYEVTQVRQGRDDTNKSYDEVMGVNPSQFYRNDVRPVDRVSWYDAVMYCNVLTTKTTGMTSADHVYTITGEVYGSNLAGTGGVRPAAKSIISANVTVDFSKRGYRLPTEAEWEYAARGGNNSPGNYIYSGSNNATLVAWYNETIKTGADSGSTQTVGTKAPNALGIYDMSGNISEWVWDWFGSYKDSYYSTASALKNPQGPVLGTERVRRGGAWSNAVGNVRSVVRNSQAPGEATWVNGFRVARGPSLIW